MTIQRQYNRPNCKLVLEGPEDRNGSNPSAENPLISEVTNVECHFAGYDRPLTGGQDLLDGLVCAVSQYVQEVLSGITRPAASKTKRVARVQIQPVSQDLHRLTVNQAANEDDPSKYQIDLKTIQLFDLVENVDQLMADDQTLPSLGVDLSPLPRRYVATQEPVAEKLIPAAIGISSLAAAAIALFLLPIPEIMPPEAEPRSLTEERTSEVENGNDSNSVGPGTGTSGSDNPPEDLPEDTPESDIDDESSSSISPAQGADNTTSAVRSTVSRPPVEAKPVIAPSESSNLDVEDVEEIDAIVSENISSSSVDAPTSKEIDKILGTAQPIADPDKLDTLTLQLRDQVDRAWRRPEELDEDLVYRVGVSESGDMVGFKPINDPANKLVDTVPLNQLDTVPISAADSFQTSVGQFRVVFRTTGVVEVSPWYGRLPEDE